MTSPMVYLFLGVIMLIVFMIEMDGSGNEV